MAAPARSSQQTRARSGSPGGASLVRPSAGGDRDPIVLRSRPDMAVDADPVGLVERSGEDRDLAGPLLERRADGGAAACAEVKPDPPPALVGAVLIRGQVAADFDRIGRESGPERERAAGAALAELAMAYHGAHGVAARLIAHSAAKASARSQSERPSKCLTGSLARSMPSRQRALTAAMSLPEGSAASPCVWMPQFGQKRCLIRCLLKV